MKRLAFPLTTAVFLNLLVPASATDPAWWSQHGVTNSSPSSNLSPATIGQAKYMAKCAMAAVRQVFPGVADAIESDLVGDGKPIPTLDPPLPETPVANAQYAPLLVGQLKAIAMPFYTHINAADSSWLASERLASQTQDPASAGQIFPWTLEASDDANKAIASIGQLKAVFALRFESLAAAIGVDTDGDGLADGWERFYLGGLSQVGTNDFDGDGLSNAWEFSNRTDPATATADRDSDADGLPDDWEQHFFGNIVQSGNDDPDGDGLVNLQEYGLLSNPARPDSDGDGMEDGFEVYYNLAINSSANSPSARSGPDDDKDFDGISNKNEWIKGSIPINGTEEPSTTFSPTTLHWFGVAGKVYFVRWSTNLTVWTTSTLNLESQNKEISLLVQDVVGGPPPPTFFSKLRIYESDVDSDGDGIPDWYEIEKIGTDPDDASSAGGDSDADGLPDGWEMFHFGGLGVADPNAVLKPDGLTNKEKADQGLNPNMDYSATYSYDPVGRLTGVTAPVGAGSYTPDDEGNLLNGQ